MVINVFAGRKLLQISIPPLGILSGKICSRNTEA